MNVGHRWDRGLPGHGVSWRVKLLLAKRRTGAPTETRAEATSENSWEGGGGEEREEKRKRIGKQTTVPCVLNLPAMHLSMKKRGKKRREKTHHYRLAVSPAGAWVRGPSVVWRLRCHIPRLCPSSWSSYSLAAAGADAVAGGYSTAPLVRCEAGEELRVRHPGVRAVCMCV